MLLILTVLGMGVPAMFAAERKSYVNQAMQALIEIHNKCQKLQRELAARGDPGVVTITINAITSKPDVTVTVPPTPGFTSKPETPTPEQWFGRKFPISINADEFISAIGSTIGNTWQYVPQTGFINSPSKITLTFKAMPTSPAGTFKVNRVLTLYPQGYSEVP